MYDPANIFARILRGEIPCNKVYEDDQVLAFHDINPAAPVHVLVIPKGNYTSFHDFTSNAGIDEIGNFFNSVKKVADHLGLKDDGYRLITNIGSSAMQTVMHFHVHIIAGKQLNQLVP